jgi:hypothetical protein
MHEATGNHGTLALAGRGSWGNPIKIAAKCFFNLGKHMVGFSGVFFEICLERWGFHQDGDRIAVVYTR